MFVSKHCQIFVPTTISVRFSEEKKLVTQVEIDNLLHVNLPAASADWQKAQQPGRATVFSSKIIPPSRKNLIEIIENKECARLQTRGHIEIGTRCR